jgi:hypothetical protein
MPEMSMSSNITDYVLRSTKSKMLWVYGGDVHSLWAASRIGIKPLTPSGKYIISHPSIQWLYSPNRALASSFEVS